MSLLRVPTTPTKNNPGQLLLMEPNQTPVGLSTDCKQGKLYWADASLKVVRSAKYNGSDVNMIISNGKFRNITFLDLLFPSDFLRCFLYFWENN